MGFNNILEKYRKIAFSERDKGDRFERLMQLYLQTDPKYKYRFRHVWMWNDFPGKKDFGGKDIGIDLVAFTHTGDYWAIQCKFFAEGSMIDKKALDSFLSTSSKQFLDVDTLKTVGFAQRLWISTTNKWGPIAQEIVKNQNPPFTRINFTDLENAPVDWKKLEQGLFGEQSRDKKKELFPHQKEALVKTHEHLKTHDRGQLIMACGTGKTFASLRIAENETNGNGLVLFLVPSIALLGQTLNAWTADAKEPINPICICSDPKITKKQTLNDDIDSFSVVDLALPASTNVKTINKQFNAFKHLKAKGMTVVFSTYQSIDVIAEAQRNLLKQDNSENPYGIFDLIICDEAHRTTGVTLSGYDESSFVKVHDNDFIKAKKRIYMTATPRLYSDDSKSKAAQHDAVLCSMDDPNVFGDEMYRIGFGKAVEHNLLSDYKVLILTMSDKDIPPEVQKAISNDENEISYDDASKLIGCINALSKQVLGDADILKSSDPDPMRRAVAFCSTIKDSKKITNTFNQTANVYIDSLDEQKRKEMIPVSSQHIDGTMSAPERDELLSWLKSDNTNTNDCKVLTNVRCLSEGVDVPSLDAVLFLSPRNSQVDVVQSVGRVMRKAPGKKYGYIIIPVVVPAEAEAAAALDNNERFKVVWTVLNALRAHDDRFNATVNKIDLNKKRPSQILIGRPDGYNSFLHDPAPGKTREAINHQFAMQFEELQGVIFAKMVKKVGDKRYWEQWAKNVAEIAERQMERIKRLIKEDDKHKKAFSEFLEGLQKNINPSISEKEAVDMLSQHIITKPVFEALFEGYSFVKNNPISQSMQKMLDLLEEQTLEKDAESLQKFYESVKMRAEGIDNAEGKQKIIIELYDKFFKTAFPKLVEKLGIVYTPVEVVDFIIHSVNDVLKEEFGRSISDENIHILDPFTGTGTFITRLLQSGLISKEDLLRKYAKELHANEIVLLAYYIAAVNIENAYHDLLDEGAEYKSFDGICLTDTFQLGETDASTKLFSDMFPQNSKRVEQQKKAPLRIIIGNPPYSRGQEDANDDAQNQSYEMLENRISETYALENTSTLSRDLYNSYMKAFRWSSDRLDKDGGIVAFITGSGFIDKGSYLGFRKSLEKEFSSIYVFNLRGGIRGRSKEDARREGQNVFDIMTGVAITILVKKPNSSGLAKIHYQEIEDYLNQKEKLEFIANKSSLNGLDLAIIKPNDKGDWINQRSDVFESLITINPTKNYNPKSKSFFLVNPVGVGTNRDDWAMNYSSYQVERNMNNMIGFYNQQVQGFHNSIQNNNGFHSEKQNVKENIFNKFISKDLTKIKWTRKLRNNGINNIGYNFNKNYLLNSIYRPFNKQHLYYHNPFVESPGIFNKIFPSNEHKNLIITLPGNGGRKSFCSLMINQIPNLNNYDGGTQCFPLYYYEKRETNSPSLFDEAGGSEYIQRDGVSDFILSRAIAIYGNRVSKEDIFYYVYGVLHSQDYRNTFANDLKKMLPRIPLVDEPRDFWKFSKAGRELAELHINYESVPPSDEVTVIGAESGNFKVNKIKHLSKDQKDTILYNGSITIKDIPEKAYQYVVNGKSAIEWILDRYQVKTHKDSGITNNPNDWADEVDNPRYILDLLLSIITVSVKTVDIVYDLPELKFE
jgi:predicted helicase